MSKINQEEYEILKKKQEKGHKYIAREKEGHVIVFTDYHGKSEYRWLVTINEDNLKYESLFNSSKVFQFIKWEDESPYNIQELIEEYEHSASIDKEQLIKRIENYIPLHDKTVGDVVDGILEIVKQFPEMEVLSPEWIDENQHPYGGDYHVPSEKLEEILVPKQEEPNDDLYILMLNGGFVTGFELEAGRVVGLERQSDYDASVVMGTRPFMEFIQKQVGGELHNITNPEEPKYILSTNITDKASKTNYETFLNKRGIFHSMDNESFNSEEFNWTEKEIKDLENGEILFEHFAVKVEEWEE